MSVPGSKFQDPSFRVWRLVLLRMYWSFRSETAPGVEFGCLMCSSSSLRMLFVIVPASLLLLGGRLINNGMTFGASAGATVVPDDHVEDGYAGDDHRQYWDEPEFHAHKVSSGRLWF